MGVNTSNAGTAHVKAIANRALESDHGITLRFPSQDEAMRFRQVFINMRMKDRKDNRRIFGEGDPRSGCSAYDALLTTITKNEEGHYELTMQTAIESLSKLTIIDNATGETIKPEDL